MDSDYSDCEDPYDYETRRNLDNTEDGFYEDCLEQLQRDYMDQLDYEAECNQLLYEAEYEQLHYEINFE